MTNAFNAFDCRVVSCSRLSELSRFKKYAAGETIIHEAEENDNVYFILEGQVKTTNFSSKGREVWHNELGPGKTIGEMAAITGQPRVSTVIALKDTQVALIARQDFFALIRHDTNIAIWIMEELASRLNIATQKVVELVSFNIPFRVRSEILKLSEPYRGKDEVIEISPLPNFSELARRINTDRENVSREISYLIKIGVLKKTKTSLILLNETYLVASTTF